MREKLSGKDPAFCKAIVSLLVDRVAVSNDNIHVSGSTAALEYALSKPGFRPEGAVPIFDRE